MADDSLHGATCILGIQLRPRGARPVHCRFFFPPARDIADLRDIAFE